MQATSSPQRGGWGVNRGCDEDALGQEKEVGSTTGVSASVDHERGNLLAAKLSSDGGALDAIPAARCASDEGEEMSVSSRFAEGGCKDGGWSRGWKRSARACTSDRR